MLKLLTMTPKEKAKEIIFKMFAQWMQIPYEAVSYHLKIPAYTLGSEWDMTKHCALIAVDEILAIFYDDMQSMWNDELSYWHQVKKEIEAL